MNEVDHAAADLLEALATYDALDTFNLLPQTDQHRFVDWVGKARDEGSYRRRISALVLAMRVGPLQRDIRVEPSPAAGSPGI